MKIELCSSFSRLCVSLSLCVRESASSPQNGMRFRLLPPAPCARHLRLIISLTRLSGSLCSLARLAHGLSHICSASGDSVSAQPQSDLRQHLTICQVPCLSSALTQSLLITIHLKDVCRLSSPLKPDCKENLHIRFNLNETTLF